MCQLVCFGSILGKGRGVSDKLQIQSISLNKFDQGSPPKHNVGRGEKTKMSILNSCECGQLLVNGPICRWTKIFTIVLTFNIVGGLVTQLKGCFEI